MERSFTEEMRESVGAANDYVGREIARAVAAGHAAHFMHEGCYLERTREGVFEVVRVGDAWVRLREVAWRLS